MKMDPVSVWETWDSLQDSTEGIFLSISTLSGKISYLGTDGM